jgi:3-hydroxybutyryl-CoA dehydrogenase
MEIKKIMVLGAGQMGGGIAQVCAQAGYQVVLRDINDQFVQRGLKVIEKNLLRGVEKGPYDSGRKRCRHGADYTDDYAGCRC